MVQDWLMAKWPVEKRMAKHSPEVKGLRPGNDRMS